MKAVFDHSHDEASNIRTFYFRPEKPLQYTAGQFAEWTIEHEADERGTRRWFTISSSPTEEFISLTTKLRGKEGSSFKRALAKLKPGDEINVSDPMGDFVLPKLIQTPLVFVAAGIGITPFHSILEWLSTTNEERPIRLIYAVRNEDEIVFQDTFDKAGVHATIIVEEPTDSWGGERGQLTAEMILGLEKPSEDTLVYVSGPEPLVEKLEKDLVRSGLNKSQFVGDFFPNYQQI